MPKKLPDTTEQYVVDILERIQQGGLTASREKSLYLHLKLAAVEHLRAIQLCKTPVTLGWFIALMLEEPLETFFSAGVDKRTRGGRTKGATFAVAWSKDFLKQMEPEERQFVLDELADRPELWNEEEVMVI